MRWMRGVLRLVLPLFVGVRGRERADRFFFLLTLAMDMTMTAAGLTLAVLLREGVASFGWSRGEAGGFIYANFPVVLVYYLLGLYVAFKYVDVYRERRFLTGNREAGRIAKAVLAFTLGNMVLAFLLPTTVLFSRFTLGAGFFLITGLVLLGRTLVQQLREALREKGLDVRVALIVGTGPVAQMLAKELMETARHGYRLVGLLHAETDRKDPVEGVRVLGGLNRLERVMRRLGVQEVFLCEPAWHAHAIMPVFSRLRPFETSIRVVSTLFNVVVERVGIPADVIGTTPIVDFAGAGVRGWRRWVKRGIDVLLSAAVLLIVSPLASLIAVAIWIESGRPLLYVQQRVGAGGRHFDCYKFRSMRTDAEALQADMDAANEIEGPMFKIREDPRVTRVGGVLRRYSLDELPQLWNVFRGDMSLVGPRPPLPKEVEVYDDWHRKRLQGPMGLSGLWQVSGRNELDFEDMALLDIYYLRNHSLFLDYRILVRTLFTVLLGQGQ